jgi:hypothetical protein
MRRPKSNPPQENDRVKSWMVLGVVLGLSMFGSGCKYLDKGDEASAKAKLEKFLKPGADYASLTKDLRPSKADYDDLFDAETASKIQSVYDAEWDKDPPAIQPKPEQTELILLSASVDDLKHSTGNSNEFPGGYAKVAPHMKANHTWYRFKFVKSGERLGMAYDGLTFVNHHWVIVPKPWRALKE